ncbi:MAG: NAD(P)-binding domain-containing protein, partial [Pseudomonadales bacterium]
MSTIGFIGLGNMGGPMAINLVKAGHTVQVFDLVADSVDKVKAEGGRPAETAAAAVANADVVISMLPASRHVEAVYLGHDGLLEHIGSSTLIIDSSTIAPVTARQVAAA